MKTFRMFIRIVKNFTKKIRHLPPQLFRPIFKIEVVSCDYVSFYIQRKLYWNEKNKRIFIADIFCCIYCKTIFSTIN